MTLDDMCFKSRRTVQSAVEILLREDNPGERLVAAGGLQGRLFPRNLSVARDGEQAMAFLSHEGKYFNSPKPDLILLDLNLPRKDGREVLAEIKQSEALRRIPVMILSTSNHLADIERAYDLHANCYITKPVDLDGLIDLGRVIECASGWGESAPA